MTISLIAMLSIIVTVGFGALWAIARALRSDEATAIRRAQQETKTSLGTVITPPEVTWTTPTRV